MCYLSYKQFNAQSKTKIYKLNSLGKLEKLEIDADFVRVKADNYEFLFNISNITLNEYRLNLNKFKVSQVSEEIYFTFNLPLATYDLNTSNFIEYNSINIKNILDKMRILFSKNLLYDNIEFSAYKIFELFCNKYKREITDDYIVLFTNEITESQFESLCKTHQNIVKNIFVKDVFGNYINEVLQYFNQVGLYNFILNIFRLYYYTGIKNLCYDNDYNILLYTQFDDYCIPYLNIKEFLNLSNHIKVFNIDIQNNLNANSIIGTYDDSRLVKILHDELLGYYIKGKNTKPILLNNIELEFKSHQQIDYFHTDINIDIKL